MGGGFADTDLPANDYYTLINEGESIVMHSSFFFRLLFHFSDGNTASKDVIVNQ